jgi:hypothetical protein
MSVSRRLLLKNMGLAAGVAVLTSRAARGAEAARLDVKDPTAIALGYVENAAQVDVKKYPDYAAGVELRELPAIAGNRRQ